MALDTLEVVKTLNLKDPVKFGDDLITQLNFTKLKAKHLKRMEREGGGPIAQGIALASILTNQVSNVIEDLSAHDYQAVQEIILSFLPNAQATTGEAAH